MPSCRFAGGVGGIRRPVRDFANGPVGFVRSPAFRAAPPRIPAAVAHSPRGAANLAHPFRISWRHSAKVARLSDILARAGQSAASLPDSRVRLGGFAHRLAMSWRHSACSGRPQGSRVKPEKAPIAPGTAEDVRGNSDRPHASRNDPVEVLVSVSRFVGRRWLWRGRAGGVCTRVRVASDPSPVPVARPRPHSRRAAELEVEIGVGTAAQSAFSSSHWEWTLQTCRSDPHARVCRIRVSRRRNCGSLRSSMVDRSRCGSMSIAAG